MFVVDEQNAGLTIKTVAERTGVSVYTLRAWERRYGVPLPRRVPGNRYRLYSEDDITDVLTMKRQIAAGVSPAQASQALQQNRLPTLAATPRAQPLAEARTALQAALLESDESTAHRILDQAAAMYTLEQVALEIIQPTMVEIGERWMHNEVTVWQEHFATHIVRQKLLAILQAQPVPPLSVPYLVSACAPAEEHELGLLIFSLFARRHGWRVSYLGQGTPLATVADLTRRSKPTVVAISVTTVASLAGVIPWLEPANRQATWLAFGGRLLNSVPALRERLPGAFLGEDALAGVRALGAIESPKKIWSPSQRAFGVVRTLQANRFKLAGDATAHLMASVPASARRTWTSQDLSSATLFLIDLLACAVAFDAPELIDAHRGWLSQTLVPRSVALQLIDAHLKQVAHGITQALGPGDARQFKTLLSRMELE